MTICEKVSKESKQSFSLDFWMGWGGMRECIGGDPKQKQCWIENLGP